MLLWAASCSRAHGPDLLVGRDDPTPRPQPMPHAGGSAAPAVAGRTAPVNDAGRPFTAGIQDPGGVTLDVVTLACAGHCFEVEAVARGGYPPYSYTWEDGSANAVRKLCPDETQTFSVAVTDRGSRGEEFSREAETVHAEVTAEVLACPDGGVSTPVVDGGIDAGPVWDDPLGFACLLNGSFEGTTDEVIGERGVQPFYNCMNSAQPRGRPDHHRCQQPGSAIRRPAAARRT